MQDALERGATRFVIVTIRATMAQWSVLHQRVHPVATSADVTTITQAATVNIPSIKRVLRRGGDHQSVDLATVRRIAALIRVVTNKQESATAGYVPVHSEIILPLLALSHRRHSVDRLSVRERVYASVIIY